jgi:hypothetical protein
MVPTQLDLHQRIILHSIEWHVHIRKKGVVRGGRDWSGISKELWM